MAKEPRFTTPTGIAVYPRLNEPDTKFKPEGTFSLKLSLDLTVPANAVFKKKIDAEVSEWFEAEKARLLKDKKKIKAAELPYVPTLDQEKNEVADSVDFKFSMTHKVTPRNPKIAAFEQRPALFDAKGQPSNAKVWGGSKLKVSFEFNRWTNAKNENGVSLRLKAVQILELVTSNGGNAGSYGFGAEEGYEGDPAGDEPAADTGGAAAAEGDF